MIEKKYIENLTMQELVDYYNANKALMTYFANTAQANIMYANTKDKAYFTEPDRKHGICVEVESKIMEEFEKRLLN